MNHVTSLLEKSNKTSEQLANELKLYSPKKCEKITDGIKEDEDAPPDEAGDAELHCPNETSSAQTGNQEEEKLTMDKG